MRALRLGEEPLEPGVAAWLAGGGGATVLGIGGDGTHMAVINALKHYQNAHPEYPLPPYAAAAFGTGNDLAKSLGLPIGTRRLPDILSLVAHGQARPFDLGRWGDAYFADALCLGLDAEILARRDRMTAWLRRRPTLNAGIHGYLVYALAGALALARHRHWQARLEIDGATWYEGPLANLVLNNVRVHAALFDVTPAARWDDGRLDAALFASRRRYLADYPRSLWFGPAIWNPGGAGQPRRCQGRLFRIETDRPIPVQLDGEVFPPAARFEVEVCPQALRLRL